MVPGTSNHWPYHTDLLVFCLKFRLTPVCEYLNYYYDITNDYWTIPEKKQKILGISLYLWNFWTKQSFNLANSVKLCYKPCKFQGKK